jgi:hypothetical protein
VVAASAIGKDGAEQLRAAGHPESPVVLEDSEEIDGSSLTEFFQNPSEMISLKSMTKISRLRTRSSKNILLKPNGSQKTKFRGLI